MLNNLPSAPYFEVFYSGNTQLTQYTPKVRIIQKTNAHAVAFLDVMYVGEYLQTAKNNTWQYLPEHTPIQINYGMRPHFLSSFVGYTASYKLLRTGKDIGYNNLTTTTVQYTIIGASQVMQSTHNVAWKNTSPSTIAGNIAIKNGMRSIIHSYPAAIQYRLQNSSDFLFLNQLANEIGYKFYVDNTDLYFVNPNLILDRGNIRNIPEFWSHNLPGIWDTVREFQPVVGTITPDGGIAASRNVVGLNPRTNQITQAQVNPSLTVSASDSTALAPTITQYYNEHPAESYYEAAQKAQADFNRNLYWNTAKATLYGDARVKPNTLVNLVGNALPSTDAGVWIVEEVEHCLTMPFPGFVPQAADYRMYTCLGRDQAYTTLNSALSETSSVTQPVAPKLIGGAWVSSNMGANIYAT